MIRFKIRQDQRESSKTNGKWYARATHEAMTFEEFINHMATHHCAFSEAVIRGVLVEMETCLRELLLDGKAVHLDELGIFRIGLCTRGAASATEFNVKENIVGCRLNLYLGKRFRANGLFKDLRAKEADLYSVDADEQQP